MSDCRYDRRDRDGGPQMLPGMTHEIGQLMKAINEDLVFLPDILNHCS